MTRAKLESFAKEKLTFGASPLQRLDRLTEHLGLSENLSVVYNF